MYSDGPYFSKSPFFLLTYSGTNTSFLTTPFSSVSTSSYDDIYLSIKLSNSFSLFIRTFM